MRLLFLGDMVGKTGRTAVWERLPGLIGDLKLDFVIVNGENAAGGFGITENTARELFMAGADCLTLGNHSWDQREALTYIVREERLIRPGDNVGMSGFTGAGYPKALPTALHDRMVAAHARGEDFRIGLWTGASTAPDADGVLAEAKGVSSRLPYNSDPTMRSLINSGEVDYVDAHLSHSAQHMWFGFYGNLDVAVVEVTAVLPNGLLVPSSSVGNNKTWLDQADRVILEVNHWQPREFEGFHDVYYGTQLPPHRRPIQLTDPMQRIGDPYLRVDPAKVVAVVETDRPDRNPPFTPPDETSRAIAGHVVDFLRYAVRAGRIPPSLLPLQSGVGNVANAVLGRSDLRGDQRMVYVMDLTQPTGMFEARDFQIRDGDTVYVTEAPFVQWQKSLAVLTGATGAANNVAATGN